MKEIVFLLEEPSAKAMLESLLERILDSSLISYRCIAFEGKQDLEKQLIRKIKHYQNPEAYFIITRDQDSHTDCLDLKNKLIYLCKQTGKIEKCIVRIFCKELETFYLADLLAVEKGLNIIGLTKHQNNKKFRNPDRLGSPSHELRKLTNTYQKISGSRAIGKHLDVQNHRSLSFKNLIFAIQKAEKELLKNEI